MHRPPALSCPNGRPRARRTRLSLSVGLALNALALAAALPPPALAQNSQVLAQAAFDIPAGPLAPALDRFARISGVNLSYDAATIAGVSTRGLEGRYRTDDGLAVLLDGTGLQAAPRPEGGYILRRQPRSAGAVSELPSVTVTGQTVPLYGADTGYVAARSETGTKTDTNLVDVPAAVSVVTRKELDGRGVQTLEQALSYTSSVSVDEYGSDDRYDYFRIRGFNETTLGTYRDGLPSRIPAWFTASRLEPYGLERIEVLKGSTSTLFGLNSPGGLVNAITKRPQDTRHAEVYTTLGADHTETGADFGGPLDEQGVWKYRLTGMWQNGDYGYDHTNDDRLYIAPALTFSPSADTSLTLLADYSRRKSSPARGYPAGEDLDLDTFLGEPGFNHFNTRQSDVGYLFTQRLADGLTFRSNARYTHINLNYEAVYGATADPTADRAAFAVYGRSSRATIDNQIEYETGGKSVRSKLLAGFDYTYDKAHEDILFGSAPGIDIHQPEHCGLSCISLAPYLDWRVRQKALGLYLQEQLTLSERWIVTLGGRYDHVNTRAEYLNTGSVDDTTETAFTKRLGLTYKINAGLAAYANYSESFQPLVAPAANGYALNDSLKPQKGRQYEVGMKYQPQDWDALFTASVFDLTQTNVPDYVTTFEQRQVGKIRVRGLELEGKFSVNDRLNASLAYSYWDGEIVRDGIEGNAGNRPDHVPRHLASAWLEYTIPGEGRRGNITLGGGVRYVGQSFGDSANTVSVGGRAIFDAAVHYAVNKNLSVQVNATNLFDREYKASCDTADCYYGDPRTVYATLRYKF